MRTRRIRPTRQDHRQLAALAVPLALTQLAQVALTTTDVVLMGVLGTLALAGGGLAITLFNQVRTMGVGLVTSTGNLVAAAVAASSGSARRAAGTESSPLDAATALAVRTIAAAAMLIATLAGLVGALILLGLGVVLEHADQSREVAAVARPMMAALAAGLVPCLWFQVLRHVSVGLRRPQRLLTVTMGSVVLNVVLDLALLHGWGVLPALGVVGIGLATTLVHAATAVALYLLLRADPVLAPLVRLQRDLELRAVLVEARRLLRLGWPTSLTYGSEAGLFTVLALVMGAFGAAALAAHTVVNQVTYIVFQCAVGLSHGVSVEVSAARAAGSADTARRLVVTAVQQSLVVVGLSGLAYLLAPEFVVRLFAAQADAATMAVAVPLLAVAAVTQSVDAAQNIAVGTLRGLDDTAAGFRLSLVGYWLIGLPVAVLAARVLGPVGVWAGLGVGLAATAALMLRRFAAGTVET